MSAVKQPGRTSVSDLRSVTPEAPCPVCTGDHKCSVGDGGDFIICGRRDSTVPGFRHNGAAAADPQFHLYRRRPTAGEMAGQAVAAGTKAPSGPEIDWRQRAKACTIALTASLAQELATELGVPVEVLLGLGVGYLGRSECWTFPEKDAEGNIVGISTRDRAGKKRMMKGVSRGVYFADDPIRTEGPILLPEGFSDAATAFAMGLSVVG